MKFELFGRLKDKEESSSGKGGRSKRGSGGSIPQEKIESMSRQGLSENEIREELRDSGYSHKQIDNALNQTVRRNAVSSSGSDYGGGGDRRGGRSNEFGGGSGGLESSQDAFSPFSGSQGGGEGGGFSEGSEEGDLGGIGQLGGEREEGSYDYPDQGGYAQDEMSAEGVPSNARELIEIMVAEELSDIDERFDQINSRMGKLEESVSSMKDKVDELSTRREEDEKEFLKRIKDMEGYLKESQSTVGGLKKTMQEVLPALSHNIKEMNKIIEKRQED